MTVLPAVDISPAGTPLCGQQVQGLGPDAAAETTDGEEASGAAGIACKLDVFLWSAQPTLESQHAIMSAAMVNARRARLRAEADRQLLANRLVRLAAEEVKASKRIEETHKRTQEILAVKTRHQQSEFERQSQRAEHDKEMERHKQQLLALKEERKASIVNAKQATVHEKVAAAHFSKAEHADNAIAIARARGAEYTAVAKKRNSVRQEEVLARERRRKEKELLLDHLKQRAEAKKSEEEAKAHKYADEIKQLQQQEQQLMAALTNHQEERRQVFEYVDSKLHRPAESSPRKAQSRGRSVANGASTSASSHQNAQRSTSVDRSAPAPFSVPVSGNGSESGWPLGGESAPERQPKHV